MRKIILFVLLFVSFWNVYWSGLSNNFDLGCFEYYKKINKEDINSGEIYKIKLNTTKDLVIKQNDSISEYKYFGANNDIYSYSNSLWLDSKFLTDYNSKTFYELNSKTQNEIIISFATPLEKKSFEFLFDYSSFSSTPTFFIWNNLDSLDEVLKNNISDFSFKYLKIKFENISKKSFIHNIVIRELNFPKKLNTILVKSENNSDIEFYSTFNCKNKDFSKQLKSETNFSVDINTKTIELNFEKNPEYNVFWKKDFDNDWIEDSLDNCKQIYNPFQKDKNWDWIWNLCSDDDRDWVLWYKDNCIDIKNSDQKDLNINWVWDVCEFDKDSDSIFDSLDNCINIPNKDQIDTDKDWIWNLCDNSIYYNPKQLDKNNNWIWDITEQKEKQLEKNDSDKDWIVDWKDNCSIFPNPNQLDSDNDWIWDACDNCKNIQNRNQLDFNDNKVWDICEDSDGDWIQGLMDNCINISNPDQQDSDNNWIWNLCEDSDRDNILFINDNCPYDYNPKQENLDNDEFWDKCDKEDNRLLESNKWIFITLLILIAAAFWWGIYMMIQKIK